MEDFLLKFPHMLSGGQQQRVVIARAMIMEPRFLVADEPVSMLDASVRVEILKLLRGLQETHNLSVIYITHDLSTVSYFSERIFVMYAGNLVEKASVRHVLDNPLHPYTMALLTGTSEPDAHNAETFKEIPPGEPPSLVNPPIGCRFHPRCPKFMPGLCDVKEPPDFEPEPGSPRDVLAVSIEASDSRHVASLEVAGRIETIRLSSASNAIYATLESDPARFSAFGAGGCTAVPDAHPRPAVHILPELLLVHRFDDRPDPGHHRRGHVRSAAPQVDRADRSFAASIRNSDH